MEQFIQTAKVRGVNGQVKNINDGFQLYVEQYYQQLRMNWEQMNNISNDNEERFYEREYQQQPEYDDRER